LENAPDLFCDRGDRWLFLCGFILFITGPPEQ
jgi:hypothetical protein